MKKKGIKRALAFLLAVVFAFSTCMTAGPYTVQATEAGQTGSGEEEAGGGTTPDQGGTVDEKLSVNVVNNASIPAGPGFVDGVKVALEYNGKNEDIMIYTLGFFESLGSYKSSAQILMERIASDGCHYEVADADDLIFFFEDMADQINGQKYIYIRIACPVDVTVTYNGENLCSAEENLNLRTDFGTLTFEENENAADVDDDRIKVLRLKEGADYEVQIVGTGHGIMNYTIGFMDENGDYSDFRRFEDIKITRRTTIDTVAAAAKESVLKIDEDGDGRYDLKLRAGENGFGEEVKNYGLFLAAAGGVLVILFGVILVIRKSRKRKKEKN